MKSLFGLLCVVAAVFAISTRMFASELSSEPFSDTHQAIVDSALPPVGTKDRSAYGMALQTQVYKRAAGGSSDLDHTFSIAKHAGLTYLTLIATGSDVRPRTMVDFGGSRTSELVPIIRDNTLIRIRSPRIVVDREVPVNGRNIEIRCDGAELAAASDAEPLLSRPAPLQTKGVVGSVRVAFDIARSEDVALAGCRFRNIQAIAVSNSLGIRLSELEVDEAPGYSILVAPGNRDVRVADSVITRSYASGVVVMEGNDGILLDGNRILDGLGPSNFHAGILVTDRRLYKRIGTTDFLLEDWFFNRTDRIENRRSPRNVLLIGNRVEKNLSSGIYLDGAIGVYVRNNYLGGNSKEGICLDNGTTSSVVTANDIVGNGRRWGKEDYVLERDFVLRWGRMEDGTSTAKVPGISIDNAVYNLVMGNNVSGNFGSGIKIVRTGFYNVIGRNIISNNNLGANKAHFFFGIELGGAVSDTPPDPAAELDFLPSRGNVIFQNVITGPHYAGIQFCPDCDDNDVFDNVILRPRVWAVEQTRPGTKNHFTNNFSPAKSRNAALNGSLGRVLIGGEGIQD